MGVNNRRRQPQTKEGSGAFLASNLRTKSEFDESDRREKIQRPIYHNKYQLNAIVYTRLCTQSTQEA